MSLLAQSANDFFKIASQKFQSEEFAAAAIEYSKAIDIEPKSAVLFNNRGLCYAKIENWTDAQSDYTTAITLDVGYKQAYLNLGNVYLKLGDFGSAVIAFDDALQIDSTYNKVYAKRAFAHFNIEDYKSALYDYNKAIESSNKEKYTLYNARGAVHEKLGNTQDAIADYDKALALNPKAYETYINRGILKIQLRKFNEAITDFTVAQSFAGMNGAGYYYRGICRISQRELVRTDKERQTVKDLKTNNQLLEMACSDLDKAKKFSYGRAFEAYEEYCVENPLEVETKPQESLDTILHIEEEEVPLKDMVVEVPLYATTTLNSLDVEEIKTLKKEIKQEIIAELLAEYELIPRVRGDLDTDVVIMDDTLHIDTKANDSIGYIDNKAMVDEEVLDSLILKQDSVKEFIEIKKVESCESEFDSLYQMNISVEPMQKAEYFGGDSQLLSNFLELYEHPSDEEFPIKKCIVTFVVTSKNGVSRIQVKSSNSETVEEEIINVFFAISNWKAAKCNNIAVNSVVSVVMQF